MPAVVRRETGRQGVMRACLDLLEAERIRHWRMNAGDRFGSYKGKRWRIRGHAKGTPDILAAVRIWIWVQGERVASAVTLLWIETKPTGGKPTFDQLRFADEARENGEAYMFVDDPTQLQSWLKENRASLGERHNGK